MTLEGILEYDDVYVGVQILKSFPEHANMKLTHNASNYVNTLSLKICTFNTAVSTFHLQ